MSKCHIVGNLMTRLITFILRFNDGCKQNWYPKLKDMSTFLSFLDFFDNRKELINTYTEESKSRLYQNSLLSDHVTVPIGI